MGERVKIPSDLVSFIEGGGAGAWAATSDGEGNPEPVRVVGSHVREKDGVLTLYLPNEQAAQAIRNVDKAREIAVFYASMAEYRAVQVKGEVIAVRESRSADRKRQEAYLQKFVAQAVSVGMPQALALRLTYWPSTAVEVAVREITVQTPGPQAGTPWK